MIERYNSTHVINVQDTTCTARVERHDTSVTGIRYKLVVTVPKNILPRRQNMMHRIYGCKPAKPRKPKHNLGLWAMDTGNALFQQLGFKYGWNPSIDKAGKYTTITFFFNDLVEAERLGYMEDLDLREVYLKHERAMAAKGLPAFVSPYRRVAEGNLGHQLLAPENQD